MGKMRKCINVPKSLVFSLCFTSCDFNKIESPALNIGGGMGDLEPESDEIYDSILQAIDKSSFGTMYLCSKILCGKRCEWWKMIKKMRHVYFFIFFMSKGHFSVGKTIFERKHPQLTTKIKK